MRTPVFLENLGSDDMPRCPIASNNRSVIACGRYGRCGRDDRRPCGLGVLSTREVLRRDVEAQEGTLMHDVVPRLKTNPGTIRASAPNSGAQLENRARDVSMNPVISA